MKANHVYSEGQGVYWANLRQSVVVQNMSNTLAMKPELRRVGLKRGDQVITIHAA